MTYLHKLETAYDEAEYWTGQNQTSLYYCVLDAMAPIQRTWIDLEYAIVGKSGLEWV